MLIVTAAMSDGVGGTGASPDEAPRPRPQWSAKAFYFAYFIALAFISPYLVLHYRSRGFSATQIGLIVGLAPIVRVVCSPLWGSLADVFQRQRQVLLVAVAGAGIAMVGIWQAPVFGLLLPAVLVYEFFGSPIVPLVDASVLTVLGRRRDQYGKLRLWGTLGWGLGGPLAGVLAERAGLNWNFAIGFSLYALGFVVALRLPIVSVARTVPFWRGLRTMATVRWWVPFMVTAFIVGLGQTLLNQLLFLRLADMNTPESIMGLSLAFIMIGELPVLYYSDRLLRRIGSHGLFLFAIVTSAIMLFAVSGMKVGWMILPIDLLHGVAFNGKALAVLHFLSRSAPKGMQATAQTVSNAISGGLAAAVGGMVGGALFDSIGSTATFRLAGVITVVAGLAFALIVYRRGASPRAAAE